MGKIIAINPICVHLRAYKAVQSAGSDIPHPAAATCGPQPMGSPKQAMVELLCTNETPQTMPHDAEDAIRHSEGGAEADQHPAPRNQANGCHALAATRQSRPPNPRPQTRTTIWQMNAQGEELGPLPVWENTRQYGSGYKWEQNLCFMGCYGLRGSVAGW